MAENGDKAIVLNAYAKAVAELRTAICTADGDIFDIDFARVRHCWLMRLSQVERHAVEVHESATTPAGLERMAPEAIAFLRRLGCEIDPNAGPSGARTERFK